jgi:predicted metal-dependent hydrolase
MARQIALGKIPVDVVLKDIKNLHLSVYPPTGRVRISAPTRMKLDTIRVYAITKLDWIKKQQKKIQEQERETPREYVERESHWVWGRRYLLRLVVDEHRPSVELAHGTMLFKVRLGASKKMKQAFVDSWYREQVKMALPALIAKWEPKVGVKVRKYFVRRMKTRWGSCNKRTGNIRFNTDLGRKPVQCLEYVVVHELVHLLEPSHNARFMSLMEMFVPQWKHLRDQLNRLPVQHEKWDY